MINGYVVDVMTNSPKLGVTYTKAYRDITGANTFADNIINDIVRSGAVLANKSISTRIYMFYGVRVVVCMKSIQLTDDEMELVEENDNNYTRDPKSLH